MAVDVVVVNYKTPDLLRDFVESYEKYSGAVNTGAGCHLYIIDIQPDDPDGWLPGLYPNYTYVATEENLGYARGCNLGASLGENDVILLANADTALSEGFQECYEELISHEDWGVLGPRQVDTHNRITAGGIFGTETSIGQRGWQETDWGQYSDVREDAMSASGSLYFIKRALWDELTTCEFMQAAYPGIEGAFIPTPHYYEETCCSYHARNHGYKIVFYGPVQMIHHWHAASEHGGWADQQVQTSKTMMRQFLGSHSIVCE